MIIWNRVTWYSKYLALLFFTLLFPLWTFYLGTQYEKAVNVYKEGGNVITPLSIRREPKPTTTDSIIREEINSGISGEVRIGPICPVETTPPDPNCAPRAYDPVLVFTNIETRVSKTIEVTTKGTFIIDLVPGTYSIKNQSQAVLPRMMEVENVVVRDNQYTDINIEFDSGIR